MLPSVCPLLYVNQYKYPFPLSCGTVNVVVKLYPFEEFEDNVGGYTEPFVMNVLDNVVPVHRLNAVNARYEY